MKKLPLHLFYEEPDPDRWLPGDRHPRRIIRRIIRGKPQPGGMMRYFLNLQAGLDRLGVKYRVNDYASLRRHQGACAHVIGKAQTVEKIPAGHPIIYGPSISSHPSDNEFWGGADIHLILISCEWFKAMYDQDLSSQIPTVVWPAGIETDKWKPSEKEAEAADSIDFLIYDKVRWEHDRYEGELLQPIRDELKKRNLSSFEIRYGFYKEEDFHRLLLKCRGMIFLCEHETQGFAYQQALSCGVPILAWDRGGYWQDPEYYPHRVKFEPVSSVPFWDDRCGVKFADTAEFAPQLDRFWRKIQAGEFKPRDYILENLTLEKCAQNYLDIAASINAL